MVRTIREHERAEALDQQDQELEHRRSRRRREVEDEDTLHDEPVGSLTTASLPPDDSGDDLKCERVQDRGPKPCDDEG